MELLGREFGDDFLGGFSHGDYAVKNYGGVLLRRIEASAKESYVGLLGRHPICVATTGLHGSVGWKMGEYVAFSRAIVSGKLNYRPPGEFKPGRNYLEFDTPERCVEAARRVFADAELRRRMMRSNREYYLAHLRPEALVKRTLDIGLAGRRYLSRSRG